MVQKPPFITSNSASGVSVERAIDRRNIDSEHFSLSFTMNKPCASSFPTDPSNLSQLRMWIA